MSNDIVTILKSTGPCLTSELIEVIKSNGVSDTAARQRVTRAQSSYIRLAGIRFAKNARFVYLPDQFGTKEYWDGLERAFYKSGRAYWNALIMLKARGGLCPKELFPVVCGAPAARTGQLSPNRILERLASIQLLKEVQETAPDDAYVSFLPYRYHKRSIVESRAILLAESVALHGVRDWARRIGFGSYGKFRIRGDTEIPLVSGIAWDLTAPSYVRPLVKVYNGVAKPGFLVADIVLGDVIGEDAINAFIRKYDMAASPLNVAPIMALFIADTFSEKAFSLAKQKGILAVTTDTLFGSEIAKALNALIKLLTDTGATASVNPEYLGNVLNSLTRIEGAANNIRGALFELAIGTLAKDVEDGYLQTGLRWTNLTGAKVELDVLLDRPTGIPLVIECKSKIPGAMVSLEEVKHWYETRVPLINEIMDVSSHYHEKKRRFEIWSNGLFHSDALQWLSKQKTEFDTYSVGWRDGIAVKTYADKASSASIRKTLNEHYFKHPLAQLAAKKAKKKSDG